MTDRKEAVLNIRQSVLRHQGMDLPGRPIYDDTRRICLNVRKGKVVTASSCTSTSCGRGTVFGNEAVVVDLGTLKYPSAFNHGIGMMLYTHMPSEFRNTGHDECTSAQSPVRVVARLSRGPLASFELAGALFKP